LYDLLYGEFGFGVLVSAFAFLADGCKEEGSFGEFLSGFEERFEVGDFGEGDREVGWGFGKGGLDLGRVWWVGLMRILDWILTVG